MMRRRRWRNWAKWACTAASGVLIGTTVGSRWFEFDCTLAYGDAGCARLAVEGGVVIISNHHKDGYACLRTETGWCSFRCSRTFGWLQGNFGGGSGWRGGLLFETGDSDFEAVGASLFYPFVLTAIPAALMWYTDRRRCGPHSCKTCGYDRRGLAGGADAKCPKCGTAPTT